MTEDIKTQTGETPANRKNDRALDVYDWMQSMVSVTILCVLAFVFIGRIVDVEGRSMNPTLLDGDKLIVSNLSHTYERGDIVVFDAPEFEYARGALVKRVIATEGQVVEIDFTTGTVMVDGQVLDEPYIAEPTLDPEDYDGPIEVPEGHVFCMGDNRNHSTDSRTKSIGCVDTRQILGKAYFVIFPLKSFGKL